MLALISDRAVQSTYVAFELGARWGAGLEFIPILAPGADPRLLEGPLQDRKALDCLSLEDMRELLGQVASQLSMDVNLASSYATQMSDLLALKSGPDLSAAELDALRFFVSTRRKWFYSKALAEALDLPLRAGSELARRLRELGLIDRAWEKYGAIYRISQFGRDVGRYRFGEE